MSNAERIKLIAQKTAACQNCPLYKTATNPVPGNGDPDAEIMLIGEAPGYWEDQKGIPFCGAAGHLLDELLSQINLKRNQVFVANILKHRPPDNRDPLPSEISSCTPLLKEQILTIKPKVIITLGRFSMNYFIPNVYISRAHGKAQKIVWEDLLLVIIPVFHPAAALRDGSVMAQLKNDFSQIPVIIASLKEAEPAAPPPPSPKQESLF